MAQTQNDYLHQFLERRALLLQALYECEAAPVMTECTTCLKSPGRYRCVDCIGQNFTCAACTTAGHQQSPLHRIQVWTGNYFAPASLWQLGIKLHLGHGGRPCPSLNISSSVLVREDDSKAEPTVSALHGVDAENQQLDAVSSENVGNDHRSNRTSIPPAASNNEPVVSIERHPPGFTIPGLQASWLAERHTEVVLSREEQLAEIQDNLFDPEDESIDDLDNIGSSDQDDDDMDTITVHYPNLIPHPPPTDHHGNRFIKVVALTGIHHLPVVACYCTDAADEYLQFMQIELFPASYKRVVTAFTFALMDDFRLSNLECKVSAYQYFQKIRRTTNPVFPHSVPNRYIELRRLSRAWRNLRLQQQHGFSFHTDHDKAGSMALFCAACPQPYVNLPANWRQTVLDLAMQYHMMDGNFKGDHLKQKYSENDVWLWRGLMYMADEIMVTAHEKQAVSVQKKIVKQTVSVPPSVTC